MKRYVVYMPDLDFFYYPYYDLFHRDNVQVIIFQEPVPMNTESRIFKKLCSLCFAPCFDIYRIRSNRHQSPTV